MDRRNIAETKRNNRKPVDLLKLPPHVFDFIASIRAEAVRYRHERNGARAEAEALRAELERLVHELDRHSISGTSFWDTFKVERPELVARRNV